MGEGFINWGYIVVEKNSILDMKGGSIQRFLPGCYSS